MLKTLPPAGFSVPKIFWAHSLAGRASHLQCEGQEFKSPWVHLNETRFVHWFKAGGRAILLPGLNECIEIACALTIGK